MANGYEGTEAEWLESLKPDTSTYASKAYVKEQVAGVAQNVRDLAVLTTLPVAGVLESGKTYGSPDAPLDATTIDGRMVTTESVVYFNANESVAILYAGNINDAPTSGVAVVSFEQGVAVFGTITI